MIERIPSAPPAIAPLPADSIRPLWSVMIPVYNCSQYLEQTLSSVLMQDPGADKMQIEVVDDCSTDADVGALVQRVGNGRVLYYRKQENMGSLRNFETCINRAQGHLVHILHGDDYILDGFYKEQESLFDKFPLAGASFTAFHFVDERSAIMSVTEDKIMDAPGILNDALYFLSVKHCIQPPGVVVKRSVYEKLGSFYAVKYGEDWEMWVRIAANFPMLYSPRQLACYRVHTSNISSSAFSTGQNIKDTRKVIGIIQNYLPADKKKQAKKLAMRHFSVYYAWMAHKMYHDNKDTQAAKKQIAGALGMSINKVTLKEALKLYIKLLLRYKQ